ncbi:hypothetical protein HDU93_002859, partial [Gonapodya sp. JEL0774]
MARSHEVVGKPEVANFLKYVATYIQFIKDHHHHEDIIFLPAFAKKGINVAMYEDDHKDLHDVLESFAAFIAGLEKNGKPLVAYTSEAAAKVAGYAEQIK